MMKQTTFMDLRFWITAPIAAAVLLLFGLYYWGLDRGIRGTWFKYPWALVVGLPMGLGNITYNVVLGSFVFMRMPVWFNGSGWFSPFFTTRLKAYREAGSCRLVDYLIGAIQVFDPNHFSSIGTDPT